MHRRVEQTQIGSDATQQLEMEEKEAVLLAADGTTEGTPTL
jgi:hypothetical protein